MTLAELVNAVFDNVQERDNGEVYVDCCFCDDQKHRLGINIMTGVAHCFKCDYKSGNRQSVVKGKRITFKKIAEEVNYPAEFTLDEGEVDVTVEEREEEIKKDKPQFATKLPKEFEPLWKGIDDTQGRRASKYLTSRAVSREQIKRHRIGFAAAGKYSYRIICPVLYGKALHGFVCRDYTGDSELKYLNSDGSKGLYNLPRLSKRRDKAILVEGVFDVLAIERAISGVDIIGNLGSKLSPKQFRQLRTYKEITIWAESDRAGVEGSIQRAVALTKKKVKVKVVLPSEDPWDDKDPGDSSVLEIRSKIAEAVPYTSSVAARMRLRISSLGPRKVAKNKDRKNTYNTFGKVSHT